MIPVDRWHTWKQLRKKQRFSLTNARSDESCFVPDFHAMHMQECSGGVSLDIIKGVGKGTFVDAGALHLIAHSTCQAKAAVTWSRSATNSEGSVTT